MTSLGGIVDLSIDTWRVDFDWLKIPSIKHFKSTQNSVYGVHRAPASDGSDLDSWPVCCQPGHHSVCLALHHFQQPTGIQPA